MTMRWQDDLVYRMSPRVGAVVYGSDVPASTYINTVVTGGGNKASGHPEQIIDGGPVPGGGYQNQTDAHMVVVSLCARAIPGFAHCWRAPSMAMGDRVKKFGRWASKNPFVVNEAQTALVTDCDADQFLDRHGVVGFNAAYTSDFAHAVYEEQVSDDPLMPPIAKIGGDIVTPLASQGATATVTLEPFEQQVYPECPSFTPAVGYPNITDSVTIRYTKDGSSVTDASTTYSTGFEVGVADADEDGLVEIRARAWKTGYAASLESVFYVQVSAGAFPIIQTKTANSGGSSVSSRSVTLDSTPTEGNLLLLVGARRAGSTAGTPTQLQVDSAGWTVIDNRECEATGQAVPIFAWKIAGASEPTLVEISEVSAVAQRMALTVVEISGADPAGPIKGSSIGTLVDDTNTDVATGSVSAAAGDFAVGLWAGQIDETSIAPVTYTSGYEEEVLSAADAFRAMVAVATKLVTGTESATATLTGNTSDVGGYGMMVVLNPAPEVDSDAPTLIDQSIDSTGENLVLTFSDDSSPMQGDETGFSLTGGPNGPYTLGTAAIDGLTMTIPVTPTVTAASYDELGDEVDPLFLAYDSGTGSVTDSADTPNDLASFSGVQAFNLSEVAPNPGAGGRRNGRGRMSMRGRSRSALR